MADYIGDSQVDLSKEQLIVGMMQQRLRQNLFFAGTIRDVSANAVPGAKSISYPEWNNNFVVNKLPYPHDDDSVTTACEPQRLVMREDKLSLDQHPNIVWEIPDSAGLQSKVDLELAALDEATYAHGASIDNEIWDGLYTGAAVANDATDSGDILTNIFCCEQELREANVPYVFGDIFYSITPAGKKALMTSGSVKITDASVYGNNIPLVKGEIGALGGARLIVSNHADQGVDGQMMWHKNAMVFGLQKAPNYETDRDIKCKTSIYSVDQFYGLKVMKTGNMISKVVAAP